MEDLKNCSSEKIIELIKAGKVTNAELTDSGICPTCFNREYDGVLFGDDSEKMLYEDDVVECFLIGNPRANGHTAISTKKHFKDMMEIDDETCQRVFLLSKKMMCVLKEVYKAESVYLCTMCDGPMNHFHVQLIPRYSNEKRGSKNFVKPRFDYVEDVDKIREIRNKIRDSL